MGKDRNKVEVEMYENGEITDAFAIHVLEGLISLHGIQMSELEKDAVRHSIKRLDDILRLIKNADMAANDSEKSYELAKLCPFGNVAEE